MHPSFPHRNPRDLFPEMVQRLEQELAAKAASEPLARVAAPAKTQPEIHTWRHSFSEGAQLAPAPLIPDAHPQQISNENKEKPVMSASTPRSVAPNRSTPRFRKNAKPSQLSPDPGRHSRKCSICNHPERDAIDSAFLQWRSADSIYLTFQLTDRRVIFRHASATGLYGRRRLNFRCALENILERGDQATVSAAGFVAAIRAYASLDDAGHWNEPVKRSIVTNEYVHNRAAENPAGAPAESPAPTIPNRQVLELETELTHTK